MKLRPIKQPVFWVGLSYFYGLGLVDLAKNGLLKNFFLICLDNDLVVRQLRQKGVSVFCLEEKIGRQARVVPRNTGHLLSHPLVVDFINQKSGPKTPAVVFFKPSLKIELLAKKHNWRLIGNSSAINKFWENKFNFYSQSKKLNLPVLPGEIILSDKVGFKELKLKWGLPLIAQTAFGWAGKGSFLIKKREDWERLTAKSRLKAKINPYFKSQTLINNACILPDGQILASPPAWQIGNQKLFATNPLSTCGREWRGKISSKLRDEIFKITQKLGKAMFYKGYLGFFGLDFLLSGKDKLFIIECNPRLTASSVFYYYLEKEASLTPLLWLHLLSFLKDNEFKTFFRRDGFSFKGGELVGRNTTSKELVIGSGLISGRYSLKGKFLGKGVFPRSKKELVLFYPYSKRLIKPGDENLRIATRERIVNEQGKINPNILKIRNKKPSAWLKKKK